MAATESTGDFFMFRNTLDKLERLVDVLGNLIFCSGYTDHTLVMQDGIIYTTKLLTEYDVNTSESNAIEELERLAMMKTKMPSPSPCRDEFFRRSLLNKTIDSKIDFLKEVSYGRLVPGGGVEPIIALERLTEVQKKIFSPRMDDLLIAKIKEVVYTATPKPITKSIITVSSASVVAASSCKQKIPTHDLLGECEEPKSPTKLLSSPLSWLQDQDKAQMRDDDDSTEDGAALTPTSTIMSGKPDY